MKQTAERTTECLWETPIGPMRGLVGRRGLRALRFPEPGELRLPDARAGQRVMSHPLGSVEQSRHLEAVTVFLDDFFAGRNTRKSPRLDLQSYGEFDTQVWKLLARVKIGETITYGELARLASRPGAARAVGGAMRRNPLVLVVPCHRVLCAGNGKHRLGGFAGGLPLKRWLLNHEALSQHRQPAFAPPVQTGRGR